MKFTIVNTISYDVEEEIFYNLLEKENITIEDYKKVVSNDFKEMLEDQIGTSEEVKNLIIKTDVKID